MKIINKPRCLYCQTEMDSYGGYDSIDGYRMKAYYACQKCSAQSPEAYTLDEAYTLANKIETCFYNIEGERYEV